LIRWTFFLPRTPLVLTFNTFTVGKTIINHAPNHSRWYITFPNEWFIFVLPTLLFLIFKILFSTC
jgi:hypothetical protein